MSNQMIYGDVDIEADTDIEVKSTASSQLNATYLTSDSVNVRKKERKGGRKEGVSQNQIVKKSALQNPKFKFLAAHHHHHHYY